MVALQFPITTILSILELCSADPPPYFITCLSSLPLFNPFFPVLLIPGKEEEEKKILLSLVVVYLNPHLVSLADRHKKFLYCLGEGCQTQNCKISENFTKVVLKNRRSRLKFHLWEQSLMGIHIISKEQDLVW